MYGMDEQEQTVVDAPMSKEQLGQAIRDGVLNLFRRDIAIEVLVEALTQLGVVVVYTDDTVKRRENPELQPDTPLPSKK